MNRRLAQWVRAGLALLVLGAGSAWAQMAPGKKTCTKRRRRKSRSRSTPRTTTPRAARTCAAFEKKYSGLKCNFVRTTAQVAFQRLQQDMQANAPVASVFSSTDVSHYPELKKHGLLLHYKPHNRPSMVDSLKQLQRQGRPLPGDGRGADAPDYNSSVVAEKDAPKNWTDLLDPKWKDKVSIGHPGLQRLRGHLGRADAEALRLGLLHQAGEEQAADRPLGQRHRDDAQLQGALVAAGPRPPRC